jgi:hypothetical protein
MNTRKPKYLNEYSNVLQRKILYRDKGFIIKVELNNAKKIPTISNTTQTDSQTIGSHEQIIKPNEHVFRIIANNINPPSAVSIINRYIVMNNINTTQLKQFIQKLPDITYKSVGQLSDIKFS